MVYDFTSTTVTIDSPNSIYNGYTGFVQRCTKKTASVLFDNYSPWEKLITFKISELREGGNILNQKL
ncbi:MAG: hypothetical protein CM15mV5_1130 [uncultured marine virus]|nr:MAG: hypothetical protein CM15mV5_1130 [uncultured marine virus]